MNEFLHHNVPLSKKVQRYILTIFGQLEISSNFARHNNQNRSNYISDDVFRQGKEFGLDFRVPTIILSRFISKNVTNTLNGIG